MAGLDQPRDPHPDPLQPADGPKASNRNMKRVLLGTICIVLLAGCSPNSSNTDQIRQNTANATRTAVRDAKAVTQGVVDGIKGSGTVNLNTASREQLMKLPGVDQERADRIVANRPYDRSEDLLKKHVVPKSEYDRIAGQVKTK
jgi:DNA uptake protein ComE-like DNA-binding protein